MWILHKISQRATCSIHSKTKQHIIRSFLLFHEPFFVSFIFFIMYFCFLDVTLNGARPLLSELLQAYIAPCAER